MTMTEMGAAEFKAHCLAILDELDDEGLVITKRGKPVAKLIPIRAESSALIGTLAGKLTIEGDILSTGAAWDAQP
jgi:prevent-host-death family protein